MLKEFRPLPEYTVEGSFVMAAIIAAKITADEGIKTEVIFENGKFTSKPVEKPTDQSIP